jgi:hypothetical protein
MRVASLSKVFSMTSQVASSKAVNTVQGFAKVRLGFPIPQAMYKRSISVWVCIPQRREATPKNSYHIITYTTGTIEGDQENLIFRF